MRQLSPLLMISMKLSHRILLNSHNKSIQIFLLIIKLNSSNSLFLSNLFIRMFRAKVFRILNSIYSNSRIQMHSFNNNIPIASRWILHRLIINNNLQYNRSAHKPRTYWLILKMFNKINSKMFNSSKYFLWNNNSLYNHTYTNNNHLCNNLHKINKYLSYNKELKLIINFTNKSKSQ